MRSIPVLLRLLWVVCTAELTFLDGQGTVLKSATVSVMPGKESYLDVVAVNDLALAVDQRKQIRATVTIPPVVVPPPTTTPTSTPISAACTLIGTLEIFDTASGKTQVVLGGTHLVPSLAVTPTPLTP